MDEIGTRTVAESRSTAMNCLVSGKTGSASAECSKSRRFCSQFRTHSWATQTPSRLASTATFYLLLFMYVITNTW